MPGRRGTTDSQGQWRERDQHADQRNPACIIAPERREIVLEAVHHKPLGYDAQEQQ